MPPKAYPLLVIIILVLIGNAHGEKTGSDFCPQNVSYYCTCKLTEIPKVVQLSMCAYGSHKENTCHPCPNYLQDNAKCSICSEDNCPVCFLRKFSLYDLQSDINPSTSNFSDIQKRFFVTFLKDRNGIYYLSPSAAGKVIRGKNMFNMSNSSAEKKNSSNTRDGFALEYMTINNSKSSHSPDSVLKKQDAMNEPIMHSEHSDLNDFKQYILKKKSFGNVTSIKSTSEKNVKNPLNENVGELHKSIQLEGAIANSYTMNETKHILTLLNETATAGYYQKVHRKRAIENSTNVDVIIVNETATDGYYKKVHRKRAIENSTNIDATKVNETATVGYYKKVHRKRAIENSTNVDATKVNETAAAGYYKNIHRKRAIENSTNVDVTKVNETAAAGYYKKVHWKRAIENPTNVDVTKVNKIVLKDLLHDTNATSYGNSEKNFHGVFPMKFAILDNAEDEKYKEIREDTHNIPLTKSRYKIIQFKDSDKNSIKDKNREKGSNHLFSNFGIKTYNIYNKSENYVPKDITEIHNNSSLHLPDKYIEDNIKEIDLSKSINYKFLRDIFSDPFVSPLQSENSENVKMSNDSSVNLLDSKNEVVHYISEYPKDAFNFFDRKVKDKITPGGRESEIFKPYMHRNNVQHRKNITEECTVIKFENLASNMSVNDFQCVIHKPDHSALHVSEPQSSLSFSNKSIKQYFNEDKIHLIMPDILKCVGYTAIKLPHIMKNSENSIILNCPFPFLKDFLLEILKSYVQTKLADVHHSHGLMSLKIKIGKKLFKNIKLTIIGNSTFEISPYYYTNLSTNFFNNNVDYLFIKGRLYMTVILKPIKNNSASNLSKSYLKQKAEPESKLHFQQNSFSKRENGWIDKAPIQYPQSYGKKLGEEMKPLNVSFSSRIILIKKKEKLENDSIIFPIKFNKILLIRTGAENKYKVPNNTFLTFMDSAKNFRSKNSDNYNIDQPKNQLSFFTVFRDHILRPFMHLPVISRLFGFHDTEKDNDKYASFETILNSMRKNRKFPQTLNPMNTNDKTITILTNLTGNFYDFKNFRPKNHLMDIYDPPMLNFYSPLVLRWNGNPYQMGWKPLSNGRINVVDIRKYHNEPKSPRKINLSFRNNDIPPYKLMSRLLDLELIRNKTAEFTADSALSDKFVSSGNTSKFGNEIHIANIRFERVNHSDINRYAKNHPSPNETSFKNNDVINSNPDIKALGINLSKLEYEHADSILSKETQDENYEADKENEIAMFQGLIDSSNITKNNTKEDTIERSKSHVDANRMQGYKILDSKLKNETIPNNSKRENENSAEYLQQSSTRIDEEKNEIPRTNFLTRKLLHWIPTEEEEDEDNIIMRLNITDPEDTSDIEHVGYKSRSKRDLPENDWCPIEIKIRHGNMECIIWSYKKSCELECFSDYVHPSSKTRKADFKCSRKKGKSWKPKLNPCELKKRSGREKGPIQKSANIVEPVSTPDAYYNDNDDDDDYDDSDNEDYGDGEHDDEPVTERKPPGRPPVPPAIKITKDAGTTIIIPLLPVTKDAGTTIIIPLAVTKDNWPVSKEPGDKSSEEDVGEPSKSPKEPPTIRNKPPVPPGKTPGDEDQEYPLPPSEGPSGESDEYYDAENASQPSGGDSSDYYDEKMLNP